MESETSPVHLVPPRLPLSVSIGPRAGPWPGNLLREHRIPGPLPGEGLTLALSWGVRARPWGCQNVLEALSTPAVKLTMCGLTPACLRAHHHPTSPLTIRLNFSRCFGDMLGVVTEKRENELWKECRELGIFSNERAL